MEHFFFRERGGLKLLICESIEKIGFKNAFSTRLGGVSCLPQDALSLGNSRQDERANVIENRSRFLSALDASDWQLVTARQIHSSTVRSVLDADDAMRETTECDALTSSSPQMLLAIQTADCMPILIADARSGAFAAVHAGWRGTLKGIVARTVERMQQEYGSKSADLHAALGPAISVDAFEVGPEVLDAFRSEFDYAVELITDGRLDGKGHLNIELANVRQLIDSGLHPARIYRSGLCTWYRNDLFFSYRRERGAENPVGRLMGVIGKE